MAAKVDPAQREKEEMREWLSECIDKLKLQIDQFESEIESLHAGSKKKKLDRDVSWLASLCCIMLHHALLVLLHLVTSSMLLVVFEIS